MCAVVVEDTTLEEGVRESCRLDISCHVVPLMGEAVPVGRQIYVKTMWTVNEVPENTPIDKTVSVQEGNTLAYIADYICKKLK